MEARELVVYNLNRLMKKHGVSQAELARAIDREVLTIHHYTKGSRFPKPENMDAICRFFKIPLTELFKEKDVVISSAEAVEVLARSIGYEIKKKN